MERLKGALFTAGVVDANAVRNEIDVRKSGALEGAKEFERGMAFRLIGVCWGLFLWLAIMAGCILTVAVVGYESGGGLGWVMAASLGILYCTPVVINLVPWIVL